MKKLFTFYFFTVGLLTTTHGQWSLTGNAGTVDGTHFLGTTDAKPLNFRISNQVAGRIDSFNLFMGFKAGGKANGAVTRNTAIGGQALSANTTGVFNTAIGNNALTANTIGSNNVATGTSALFVNTQGTGNTASGYASLYANTIGNYNVATGGFSLFSNVGGTGNTGIGYSALYSNKTGHYNIGIGFSALRLNIAGNSNTAIGTNAMLNNNADSNVAIGTDALHEGRRVRNTVAVGSGALYNITGGTSGEDDKARYNTAVGFKSLFSTTTGNENTAVGARTLYKNISGNSNTAVGYQAFYSNTTGYASVAVGSNTLFNNTEGYYNVAVGHDALSTNKTGHENTALGYSALFLNNKGSNNIAIGANALFANDSSENVAIGNNSLSSNTTGSLNVALGYTALSSNNKGSNNTAIGHSTLIRSTTGIANTALGTYALEYNIDGNNNTAVGSSAGPAAVNPSLSNTTSVGFGAIVTKSDQVVIGNTLIGEIGGYKNWSNLSDVRFKNIKPDSVPGLAFINQLTPIMYTVDVKKLNNFLHVPESVQQEKSFAEAVKKRESEVCTGFSAQDVKKAADKIGYDFSGVVVPEDDKTSNFALRYAEFVVPLTKAVQELHKLAEEQMNEIKDLRKEIAILKQQSGIQSGNFSSPIKMTTADNLAIFPNPTKDGFSVQIPTDGYLSVYEIGTGKEMTRGPKSILRRGAVERFNDTQNWAAGTYMIVLKDINGTILASGKLLYTK